MTQNQGAVFSGCMPALMTPCNDAGHPNFSELVCAGRRLIDSGMRAVIYCGSMGDWPLLSLEQRMQGVEALVSADIPVIVGTGAQNTAGAVSLSQHAKQIGAAGLMVIPRVLSRSPSSAAQYNHFAAILSAADTIPAVIYNSPYYGFETKADLFFRLRQDFDNLLGFKEFGGADALTYAAEHITSGDESLSLMVGVDTQVVHGIVNCGAKGAITGIGNALPIPVLRLVELCNRASAGDNDALRLARELDDALHVLSCFDEGPDLVLYYKHLMVLQGHSAYQHQIFRRDVLSPQQRAFVEMAFQRFTVWWEQWPGAASLQ